MEGMKEEGMKIFKNAVKDRILGNISEDLQKRGIQALHERVDDYFDIMNIHPVFVQEDEDKEGFERIREKLNTEPGFVIANHPGYIDVAAILRSLSRDDVKVMVSNKMADDYKKMLGDDYIIPASRDGMELVSIVREIRTHIENGGLFVMFPSGKLDLDKIEFRNGFPLLVNQVDPETMVYNFYFNEDDARKIEEELPVRNVGMASELFSLSNLNINGLENTMSFKIREAYTKASEWQDELSKSDKSQRGEIATKHYKDIFGV